MIFKLFLSWALPIIVVAYLVVLIRLVSLIRKEEGAYWQTIGNPSLWDPNGQAAILKRIFIPKFFPKRIAERHKLEINIVRILGIAGLIAFAAILLLIGLGRFEK